MNQKRNKQIQFIIILLTAVCCSNPSFAQVSAYTEYMVKAAFLERFTRFVEWPVDSDVHDPDSPFVIAVIGKNPFNSFLEKLYANQKIKNKTVEIRYISGPEEISDCHILFISNTWKDELQRIIATTRHRPILTVGDTVGFAARDVHINLYSESKEYPFEINIRAVRKAGLEMDYHLLDLARIVE